jgi:hypothetical protein
LNLLFWFNGALALALAALGLFLQDPGCLRILETGDIVHSIFGDDIT